MDYLLQITHLAQLVNYDPEVGHLVVPAGLAAWWYINREFSKMHKELKETRDLLNQYVIKVERLIAQKEKE